MNVIKSTLQQLTEAFKQADVGYEETLGYLKKLADQCNYVTIIRCMDSNLVCYMNDGAQSYFGLSKQEIEENGISFVKRILHPDFKHVHPVAMTFLADPENYNKPFEYIYLFKTANGWTWTYTCFQIIALHPDGRPRYILSVADDVNNILNNNHTSEKLISEIDGLSNLQLDRYLSLSSREKEILRLISKEYTTNEIAKELFIGKATVDSHRKNLLKKLNVKSAIGLAKYILLFESDAE